MFVRLIHPRHVDPSHKYNHTFMAGVYMTGCTSAQMCVFVREQTCLRVLNVCLYSNASSTTKYKYYTHVFTHIHTHAHSHTYTYTHTYTRIYTHIHKHTLMHTHSHTYTHTHAHSQTHTHTHIHTHIHTHSHT